MIKSHEPTISRCDSVHLPVPGRGRDLLLRAKVLLGEAKAGFIGLVASRSYKGEVEDIPKYGFRLRASSQKRVKK